MLKFITVKSFQTEKKRQFSFNYVQRWCCIYSRWRLPQERIASLGGGHGIVFVILIFKDNDDLPDKLNLHLLFDKLSMATFEPKERSPNTSYWKAQSESI